MSNQKRKKAAAAEHNKRFIREQQRLNGMTREERTHELVTGAVKETTQKFRQALFGGRTTGKTKKYQSNAQWPKGQYPMGNDVSTDKHRDQQSAEAVCKGLEKEGWGCEGKVFPIRTWVSEIQERPPITPETLNDLTGRYDECTKQTNN